MEKIEKNCPFCDIEELKPRIFYDKGNWFAFLARTPLTDGHTILAAYPGASGCPRILEPSVLIGVDIALGDLIEPLRGHYKARNILFTSLRGSEPHFHFHLIPLLEKDEAPWRCAKGYKEGHLHELLGHLEKEAEREKRKRCWSDKDIEALRSITGYRND